MHLIPSLMLLLFLDCKWSLRWWCHSFAIFINVYFHFILRISFWDFSAIDFHFCLHWFTFVRILKRSKKKFYVLSAEGKLFFRIECSNSASTPLHEREKFTFIISSIICHKFKKKNNTEGLIMYDKR